MNNEIVNTIKHTIKASLPESRILLFGSQVNDKANNDSDYDLLIITPNLFTQKEKLSWSSSLHKAIVKSIRAPVDLLIYSEAEIFEKQKLPGHIVRSAMREGIVLI